MDKPSFPDAWRMLDELRAALAEAQPYVLRWATNTEWPDETAHGVRERVDAALEASAALIGRRDEYQAELARLHAIRAGECDPTSERGEE